MTDNVFCNLSFLSSIEGQVAEAERFAKNHGLTIIHTYAGRAQTGTRHHYYYCHNQRKKLCNKKPVRQAWIENLVLEYVLKIVQAEELLEYIAENTYNYYIAQNTDTAYTKSLQKIWLM